MNKQNGHIFISYAREDRGRVAILARLFESDGWSVWWDRENMSAGRPLNEIIGSAIDESSCVLVCWSKASIKSRWVIDEATEGLNQEKLLPVLFDTVKPPLGFRNIHHINLTEWDNEASHAAYQRLKAELIKIQPLTKSEVPTQKPAKSKISKSEAESVNVQKPIDRLGKPPTQPGDKPGKLPLKRNVRAKLTPFIITFVVMAAIGILYVITNEPVQPGPVLPEMVTIKKGSLKFPAENGDAPRILKVDQDFEIGKYAVTFAEYDYFVSDTKKVNEEESLTSPKGKWGRGKQPVINVNWYEAVAYTQWFSEKAGKVCTLPIESQWEYAARAGSIKEYGIPAETGGSDNITGKDLANCAGCASGEPIGKTTEVGKFKPNAWGLYDMHGNVWEWNLNEYDMPENTAPEGNAPRVLRGGSWYDSPGGVRASVRGRDYPGSRYSGIGFRVVCSSPITR